MHHFGRKKGKGSIIFLVTFMFWNIGEKHDFLLKSTWQEKSNLQSMYIVAGLESLLLYLREEKEAKSKSRAWWKSNVRKIQLLYMGEAFQRRISNPYPYPLQLPQDFFFQEIVAKERSKVLPRWAATNRLCWKFLPCGMTACGCSCKPGGHSRPLETELEAAEITAESGDPRTGWWDDWVPGNLTARKE